MNNILKKLKGGDLRSIGRADEVAQDIINNPKLFKEVFKGMLDSDPVIRMRAADAIEKVSLKNPKYLRPFKSKLINQVAKIEQQEVRWHVAQMFSYLNINQAERDQIIKILFNYLKTDRSNIVKVFSMQTLANLAQEDEEIKPEVVRLIKRMIKKGSLAVKNRGKRLISELDK